jgi:hypothetical protein
MGVGREIERPLPLGSDTFYNQGELFTTRGDFLQLVGPGRSFYNQEIQSSYFKTDGFEVWRRA